MQSNIVTKNVNYDYCVECNAFINLEEDEYYQDPLDEVFCSAKCALDHFEVREVE